MYKSIKDLPAYLRMELDFAGKGYKQGDEDSRYGGSSTVSRYANNIAYGRVRLSDIPEEFRTRELFLHSLSGCHQDVMDYAKRHAGKGMFDRQFFKDAIATDYYNISFEDKNIFSWMPLEYIDEEMVMCAMFKAINMRYAERRNECEGWFYSVHERKPEVLNRDLFILGARCFASKRGKKNRFLSITPEEYRDFEYYLCLCLENNTPVMEDIPAEYLTNGFLITLINENNENIQCFTKEALERVVITSDRRRMRVWKAVVRNNGFFIKHIPLNAERVKYFLSVYGKDSFEYEYGFKDAYKDYMCEKEKKAQPKDTAVKDAANLTIALALSGCDGDSAIVVGSIVERKQTNYNAMLPITYRERVPEQYCKQYDKEEYLLEIYKKLGIEVGDEANRYYYNVALPEGITVDHDDDRWYSVMKDGKEVLRFFDYGPFYDRSVYVTKVNVAL